MLISDELQGTIPVEKNKIPITIPRNLQFMLRPKRLKIAFGGRGGYKTVSFAKIVLFLAARHKKRVLCLREFMNSLEDSVHSCLKEEIETMGMSELFRVTDRQIKGPNDSLFRYASMSRNIGGLRSKHDYDIAWVEEAETVRQRSLDVLFPTIRKPGSEVWMTFNPDDEFGAVYEMVKPHLATIRKNGFYEDENTYIVKTSLEDNPFAPHVMLEESARMKRADLKKWLHIYGGEVAADYRDSLIQPEWIVSAIDAHKKLKGFTAQGLRAVSFDPADTGDAKALMKRHGSVVTGGYQWFDGELPEAIDRAFQEAFDYRAEQLVYDAVGIGRGVKVKLTERIAGKQLKPVAFEGSASVDFPTEIYADHKTHKDTFRNKRAQYYWLLRDRFEATHNAVTKGIYTDPDKLISLSSDIEDMDVLKSELVKIKRITRATSYIQIEPKENLDKSTNMSDALKMLFATESVVNKPVHINFLSEW